MYQIAQLTQAGAGLIGVILHLRSTGSSGDEAIWHLALQGLPAAIQVLRQLGKRVRAHAQLQLSYSLLTFRSARQAIAPPSFWQSSPALAAFPSSPDLIRLHPFKAPRAAPGRVAVGPSRSPCCGRCLVGPPTQLVARQKCSTYRICRRTTGRTGWVWRCQAAETPG